MAFDRFRLICVLLVVCCAMPAAAQRRSSARIGVNNLGAPIPTPILNGKRAFISYEMGEVTAFPSHYSGGPERAYSEFFTQMKHWGHYELVADPKDADVIFAIRFVDPPNGVAQLRLGILDAGGQVSLWGFVEQVSGAIFKKNRDNEFTESVGKLLMDMKNLVEPAAGAPPAP